MIPLVNPALSRPRTVETQSWFGGTTRWIVVVLALVAALDAAYLTVSSFTHGVVAGCDGTGAVDCDAVLASPYSRVLGLPVALGGFLCYTAILALAILVGSQSFNDNRWLGTALIALSLLAAGSGIWFTMVQLVALGKICWYCLAVHICGVTIAALVLWSALSRQKNPSFASRSHLAMAAVVPGTRRTATASRPVEGPALWAAIPVAGTVLAVLMAAQLVFPARAFQANTPALAETIDMTNGAPAEIEENSLSPDAQQYVANRVGDEDSAEGDSASSDDELPGENSAESSTEVEPQEPKDPPVAADKSETKEQQAEAPALRRDVTMLKGRLKINTYDEAVLGSPDAKHVVIELMDYTCPHCRTMHVHVLEALERYGDQLAVVIMPVPLELECNKRVTVTDPSHRGACRMSKLALAVAKIAPEKFIDYHNFLLTDEDKPPTTVQMVERAFRLVGRDKLRELNKDPNIDNRIQKYIGLFTKLSSENSTKTKSFGLPIQIVGDTLLSGGDMSEEEMFEAWEKALGIKPL